MLPLSTLWSLVNAVRPAAGLEPDPARFQAGASFPLVSSPTTHENCVCVSACVHVHLPTSAAMGKGGPGCLLQGEWGDREGAPM